MLGTTTLVAVATYGFFKNFSPDNQYFSDFLTGHKNFTRAEVTQEIYPVVVYSNLPLILVALVVTDLLKYKPVIVFGSVALICTKFFLYYGTSVLHMQVGEMFYSFSKASNLGYNTYIYTQIKKENYQFATAVVYISPKIGILFSILVGQSLLFFQLASLENLMQINMIALILALIMAFTLPNLSSENVNGTNEMRPDTKQESPDPVYEKYKKQVQILWKECKSTHSNPYLLKWYIWMIVTFGVSDLALHYYAQALWSEVSGSNDNVFNGLADGIYMIFSMTGCYIAGKVKVDWEKNGDMILALITLLKGSFILASSYSSSVVCAYAYYVIYAVTSDVSLVLYRAEVAQHVENFGLIFGMNLFFAVFLQSVLTFLLTSRQGLALPIRDQFSAVAWCLLMLGAVFGVKVITNNLFVRTGRFVIQQEPGKTNVQDS